MSQRPMPVVAVKDPHEGQFLYLGNWVNKEHFRAFVYNEQGEEKLADNYREFESLTQSGVWYAERPMASVEKAPLERKQKHDSLRSNR